LLEEVELIEKAKDGNKSALNTLFQLNHKTLFGFVIKMTANETIAQDITQETLFKAFLSIKKFKGNAKFSTWLISISINVYKDYLRKKSNLELQENTVSDLENTEDRAIMYLQYKEAINELKQMPLKKRTAFVLKHYYGYSLEEISEIMNCPVGTVKSRISNCIDALRKSLK
jgi:RNA polymerase sigma-70 factor, ECF subfamily